MEIPSSFRWVVGSSLCLLEGFCFLCVILACFFNCLYLGRSGRECLQMPHEIKMAAKGHGKGAWQRGLFSRPHRSFVSIYRTSCVWTLHTSCTANGLIPCSCPCPYSFSCSVLSRMSHITHIFSSHPHHSPLTYRPVDGLPYPNSLAVLSLDIVVSNASFCLNLVCYPWRRTNGRLEICWYGCQYQQRATQF